MKAGILASAFIIWRLMGSGQGAWIQCEKFEEKNCGMNFYECTTKMEHRCVQNVEILEISPNKVEGKVYRASKNADFSEPPFWW